MRNDIASPLLRLLIREQDIALLRLLLREKPDGPLDAKRRDEAIEQILKRLEGSR